MADAHGTTREEESVARLSLQLRDVLRPVRLRLADEAQHRTARTQANPVSGMQGDLLSHWPIIDQGAVTTAVAQRVGATIEGEWASVPEEHADPTETVMPPRSSATRSASPENPGYATADVLGSRDPPAPITRKPGIRSQSPRSSRSRRAAIDAASPFSRSLARRAAHPKPTIPAGTRRSISGPASSYAAKKTERAAPRAARSGQPTRTFVMSRTAGTR